jgi:hypothetical protein
MSRHADKQRSYRQRQADGLAVFVVIADEIDTLEFLERAGLLQRDQRDSRDAANQALSVLFNRILKRQI